MKKNEILAADDGIIIQNMHKTALVNVGYSVVIASNGIVSFLDKPYDGEKLVHEVSKYFYRGNL